jgi:hypothetical protein
MMNRRWPMVEDEGPANRYPNDFGSESKDFKSCVSEGLGDALIHANHHFGRIPDLKKKLGIILNVEPFHLLLNPLHIIGHFQFISLKSFYKGPL